jgi:hypothetical protein
MTGRMTTFYNCSLEERNGSDRVAASCMKSAALPHPPDDRRGFEEERASGARLMDIHLVRT